MKPKKNYSLKSKALIADWSRSLFFFMLRNGEYKEGHVKAVGGLEQVGEENAHEEEASRDGEKEQEG